MEDIGIGEHRNASPGDAISDELRARLAGIIKNAYRDDFILVEQLKRLKEARSRGGREGSRAVHGSPWEQ